jgi:uroporphyrinogen-III synthase
LKERLHLCATVLSERFFHLKMSEITKEVPVLLLKTKSTPADGYEEYFRTADDRQYKPVFVPVLEHQFREDALQHIQDLIVANGFCTSFESAPEKKKYGGIIFTSQRAVEAVTTVIGRIRKQALPLEELLPHHVPFYVVGPATARGLSALELSSPVLGEETGNGEALAQFIMKHYNSLWHGVSNQKGLKPPLLFLVGEQRRDIIPKTLQSETLDVGHRIGVDELVVYETGEMHSFRSDFTAQWRMNQEQGSEKQWVVVFSPTGCGAMLESLGLLNKDTGKVFPSHSIQQRQILIVTIGPTTRDYLQREFGFEADACAESPNPKGVGNAIKKYSSLHCS